MQAKHRLCSLHLFMGGTAGGFAPTLSTRRPSLCLLAMGVIKDKGACRTHTLGHRRHMQL